ncbi:MAG: DUF2975 domain-containing protein [Proteobacteria bacterium]|nr:DUF2975 domain-containing protein [Pseudomonadota bacterium]
MTVSPGLKRASRLMAALALAGAALTPLVTVLVFVFPEQTRALDIQMNHLGAPLMGTTPLDARLLALLCEAVPTAFATWALIALVRLFGCFATGEIFSARPLKHLSQVTLALFANVLSSFIAEAPISYLLTHSNPPGHRYSSLSLGSEDVQLLFLVGVAFVIARVMAEARRMADENESFV